MEIKQVKQLIEAKLPGCQLQINSDDGRHFIAIVVSALFCNITRVQQQQMVYDALREQIANGSVHALSLKTYTPDEWAALKKPMG